VTERSTRKENGLWDHHDLLRRAGASARRRQQRSLNERRNRFPISPVTFENSGGRGSPCLSQRQLFRRYEDDDPKAVSHRKPAIEAAGYSAADEQQRRTEAEDWSEESDRAGGTEESQAVTLTGLVG
jgi:hypothetical protein